MNLHEALLPQDNLIVVLPQLQLITTTVAVVTTEMTTITLTVIQALLMTETEVLTLTKIVINTIINTMANTPVIIIPITKANRLCNTTVPRLLHLLLTTISKLTTHPTTMMAVLMLTAISFLI